MPELTAWISLLPETLGFESVANLVNIWGLGEADVHVGAAPEIDAVAEAALVQPGDEPCDEENGAQAVEVFGLAHPVDIGLFKELNHAEMRPFFRLQRLNNCSQDRAISGHFDGANSAKYCDESFLRVLVQVRIQILSSACRSILERWYWKIVLDT